MSQPHDLSRLVGRTVVIVENRTSPPAHVVATDTGGIVLHVGERQRFLEPDVLHNVEFDPDDGRLAAAASP